MSKLLEISNEELELVIQNTSDRLNMSKAIVEKDLWVCNDLCYRQVIVFNFPSAPLFIRSALRSHFLLDHNSQNSK